MNRLFGLLALGMVVLGSAAKAEEIKTGLSKGDSIGAFHVTKCAGAEGDGVDVGDNTCYRCRNKTRPQVMVFTKSTDDKVVKLINQLDGQLTKHEDAQLRAFVNMLGKDKDAAMSSVKKLAKLSKAKKVPFVVPDQVAGPSNYKINKKAAVTVLVANEGKVVANYAFAKADDIKMDVIMKTIETMVN